MTVQIYSINGHVVVINGGACATGGGTPMSDAPRAGVIANGGDQSFGQTTTSGFVSYTASGPGTAAYTAVQTIGSADIVFGLGGSYEGWQASGRNKQNLVTAIKGQGTYPNTRNQFRTPYVFPYAIIESSQNATTGLPYQTYTSLVISENWWTFLTGGGTGTMLQSPNSGFFEINYSYAWDTSAGSAGLDTSICGNVYGSFSAGQGPAQSAATYFASALLTNNPQDSRFTSLNNGAAPNADGLFLDNCFIFPNGGGNVASTTASWDGIGTQTSSTIAAYPSGASSLLSRGQYHFYQTMQSYLATCNPGSTYYNIGNFGNYFNTVGYGNIAAATANAMSGMFHGGLVETVAGTGGSSFQSFQTFADVLQNYVYIMAFCIAPKLVGLGFRMPATDGSSTATWTISGTATTVSTGTAQEGQCIRAAIGLTALNDGYTVFYTSGDNYALTRWPDEFGDDSQTQVNVKRGYLGPRVGSIPTSAAFANGVWMSVWTGGVVLFNPWGNGAQTITLSQLQAVVPGNYRFLNGTQFPTPNSGAVFSTYTFGDPDGLVLIFA
jgi:hypothetical protein